MKLGFLFNWNTSVLSFSPLQLSRTETRLDLTIVRVSTTLYKKYWSVNLEKRQIYWEMLHPHGMVDIKIWEIIDLDTMVLFLILQIENMERQ